MTSYPFAGLVWGKHLCLLCPVLDVLEEVDLQQPLSQHHTLKNRQIEKTNNLQSYMKYTRRVYFAQEGANTYM
jgi:hypothetical protein